MILPELTRQLCINVLNISEKPLEIESFLQSPVVANFLSLCVGILASLFAWWCLNHWWVPNVRFAPRIAKYKREGGRNLFVCAFINSGRRDFQDVEVVTRIGVKKFEDANSWIFFSLKTNASKIPSLEPSRRALVHIFDERKKISYVDEPPFSLKVEFEKIRYFEEMFRLGSEVTVQVHAFGHDKASGAQRLFSSPTYTSSDLHLGRYEELMVVYP